MTEDEMAGWHHRLNGHGFEQSLGVGYGQGSQACCSPRGCKKSDMTQQLNSNSKNMANKEPSHTVWEIRYVRDTDPVFIYIFAVLFIIGFFALILIF